MPMTVQERILMLKLLEKQKRYPQYTEAVGIRVEMVRKDSPQNNGGRNA